MTSRYSPVRTTTGGRVTVELAGDHPGVTDPDYRARRDELAGLAAHWRPGLPLPEPSYSPEEHEVWATVSEALVDLHEQHACSAFLAGKEAVRLPADRVPQLSEVGESLEPLCGFRYWPVAGLAPLREFYGSFGDGVFWSTQYLRHPSVPLYTPEPDIIHEVIGHANQLASPRFAAITRAAGEASRRLETEEAMQFVADVFWFSIEFGVIAEDGETKAYGAGILSSYGEMDEFGHMDIRPLDLHAMGTQNYDITAYQPVLFRAESLDHLEGVVGHFFETVDDDLAARLRAEAHAPA